MVSVSASTKIHAFALAEQLQKHHKLDWLFTSFASEKNKIARKFIKRIDKEEIDPRKIQTNILLAVPIGFLRRYAHIWNNLFDRWVSVKLKNTGSLVFIGWSGMSLHCIHRAKKLNMITILERGSSHIQFQNEILETEFRTMGKSFSIPASVIKKELKEYQAADYISVPSFFVRDSFVAKGISPEKIFVNPYGASRFFIKSVKVNRPLIDKFRIIYLGTLSVRKGLLYLFKALQQLNIPAEAYEVLMLGNVEDEIQEVLAQYKKPNWLLLGHVAHHKLPEYLNVCDIGVQPSLEEGLSLVIPQMMACGIPVIITPNTGGENIIQDWKNGFVVPIRNPEAIAEKLNWAYNHPSVFSEMKTAAAASIHTDYTWDDYGNRYSAFLTSITSKRTFSEAK